MAEFIKVGYFIIFCVPPDHHEFSGFTMSGPRLKHGIENIIGVNLIYHCADYRWLIVYIYLNRNCETHIDIFKLMEEIKITQNNVSATHGFEGGRPDRRLMVRFYL